MTYPEYVRLKAIDLRVNRKMTIDDIAECLDVSRTTVFYWVKNLSIPSFLVLGMLKFLTQ